MSPCLGRRDSVERLRRDIVDLQGAILDVFSRTGPVRFPSWKFPDKLSCNLDTVALLEQYYFEDGEETFNQNSHMVLLELVIDRLLLLLQSFSVYIEPLRINHRTEHTPQTGCVSVGLVVRHYWSNLVDLANQKAICKDSKKDTRTKTFDRETESASSASPIINSGGHFCRSASSSSSSFKFCPQNHDSFVSSSPTHDIPCSRKVSFSCDTHNASCQTVEPSLLPCAACAQVQSILKQTGAALVELFQSEGLPCSLEALLTAVENTVELGHMTAGDVAQWASEQRRDMGRLAKHIKEVWRTVKPLRKRVAAAETEREQLRSQMERAQAELKQEMANYQTSAALLERSLQEAQRSMRETEQRLQEEKEQLKKETLSVEERNNRLREDLAEHQETLQALESEKKLLQEEVKTLQVEEEARRELEGKIQQLESHMSKTQLLLDIESAKYHSACRQQESTQVKQRCLLERVDDLDQEYEELQRQLGESEERETRLQDQLKQTSEEKERLQAQIAQIAQQQTLCVELQKEKQTLETQVGELKKSVAELKEDGQTLRQRERLLVAFPELNSPTRARPQSTGDVLLDMEQQLQANCIRITTLEQENATLCRSLVKLRERAQSYGSRAGQMIFVREQVVETPPQQTWGLFLPSTPTENQQNHVKHNHTSTLLSSSSPRLDGRKASRGESGLMSVGSVDRFSSSSSSSSRLIRVQTLHLNTDCTTLKSKMRSRSTSHLRALNHRREWNP